MSHQIEVAWDLVEWEPRDFDQETVVIIPTPSMTIFGLLAEDRP